MEARLPESPARLLMTLRHWKNGPYMATISLVPGSPRPNVLLCSLAHQHTLLPPSSTSARFRCLVHSYFLVILTGHTHSQLASFNHSKMHSSVVLTTATSPVPSCRRVSFLQMNLTPTEPSPFSLLQRPFGCLPSLPFHL